MFPVEDTPVTKILATNRFSPIPVLAVLAGLCAAPMFSPVLAGQIALTGVAGFPNERTFNDPPVNAIDGDTNTYTWVTQPNNTAAPSYLAVGFDAATIDRIRLWKIPYGGGGNNSKNLIIQYTVDTGPLSARSYTTVADLISGYAGTEIWDGQVNLNGTVLNDVLDSTLVGWGSLTFDPVSATGIRIGFSNPNPIVPYCDGTTANQTCNHYRVAEFEVYNSPIPEPMSLIVFGVALAGLGAARRVRV